MESFKILTIKIMGIAKCIKKYTSEPSITNILDELETAINTNNVEVILFACNSIVTWYKKNISDILSNQFVYNKDVHRGNIELMEHIIQTLKENRSEYIKILSSDLNNSNYENINQKDLFNILNKFHNIVVQLRDRYDERTTLDVEDEYDVQDLLHALLKLYCEDIRTEEWCPSYAGTSSRQDFLLKNEKIVIETKKTRKGLSNKELANELIIDINRYSTHPDCSKLICFVYDPENRVKNPRGFEADLTGLHNKLEVFVVVKP